MSDLLSMVSLARGCLNDALDALERARDLVESREIVQIRPIVNAWLGLTWTRAGRPARGASSRCCGEPALLRRWLAD